jgi:hypothetical protein
MPLGGIPQAIDRLPPVWALLDIAHSFRLSDMNLPESLAGSSLWRNGWLVVS